MSLQVTYFSSVTRQRASEEERTSVIIEGNRPISVYRLGEMPIESCGQSVSAPRVKVGAR